MPTVVDSLIVTLGLDASQFTKAQKEAVAAFKRTTEASVKNSEDMEKASGKAGDAIVRVRNEALALFAVLAGTKGVKEFFGDLLAADAQLGRFSQNLGESPTRVAGWGAAVERVGGTTEAFRKTMEGASKTLYDFHAGAGQLPDALFRLEAITGKNVDFDHGVDTYLQGIAEALQKVNAADPGKAHQLAQGLGIDDGTARVMMNNGAAVTAYVDALGKFVGPSGEAIQASQNLETSLEKLQQEIKAIGNDAIGPFATALTPIVDDMNQWLEANRGWLDTKIADGIHQLGDALKQIDLKEIVTDVGNFAKEANEAVKEVTSWKTVLEGLVATWAAWKAIQVAATVRTAFGGLGGGGGSAGAAAAPGGGASALSRFGYGIGGAFRLGGIIMDAPDIGSGGDQQRQQNYDAIDSAGNWLTKHLGLDALRGYLDGDKGEGVKVDGADVTKGNPLPVYTVNDDNSTNGLGIGGDPDQGGGRPNLRYGPHGRSPNYGNLKDGPVAKFGNTRTFDQKAPEVMRRLMKDFNIDAPGAAKILGNLGHESAGFTQFNEVGGGSGIGWAQWTGSRAREYRAWAAANGLDPHSDEANYGMLRHDLKGRYAGVIDMIKRGASLEDVERAYEGAGIKAYGSRHAWERRALAAYAAAPSPAAEAPPSAAGSARSPFGSLVGVRNFGASGAAGAAAVHHVNNDNSVSTSSSSNEVHIGNVQINAPNATDADGIAQSMKGAVGRTFLASGANYGLR